MYRFLSAVALLLLVAVALFPVAPSSVRAAESCANYDAWEWAQSVFDADPKKYGDLDPDGDGIACPELPKGGFAPAFWTGTLPENLEQVEIIRIIDGDTFEVLIDGVSNRVRIYRADTPETQNEQECGGPEATEFATFALSLNDEPGMVYMERDENTRDKYGRELAYLWFTVDGTPYMLNHILINAGWAADKDYGDRKYAKQFKAAADFAKRHDLGVWPLCGGFEVPATALLQPTPITGPSDSAGVVGADCDSNYSPCVPVSSSDLDCRDIGFRVQVIGSDPHGFDGNHDGWGCESY